MRNTIQKAVSILFFISFNISNGQAQTFKSKLIKNTKHYCQMPIVIKLAVVQQASNTLLVSNLLPNIPKSPKTFMDLSPEVQRELIRRLGHLEDNGNGLMEQLKKNFSNKSASAPETVLDIIDLLTKKYKFYMRL